MIYQNKIPCVNLSISQFSLILSLGLRKISPRDIHQPSSPLNHIYHSTETTLLYDPATLPAYQKPTLKRDFSTAILRTTVATDSPKQPQQGPQPALQ